MKTIRKILKIPMEIDFEIVGGMLKVDGESYPIPLDKQFEITALEIEREQERKRRRLQKELR